MEHYKNSNETLATLEMGATNTTMQTKQVIGLFLKRLNIGTLVLLETGEYLFLINFTYRERLLKESFPFDNYFHQGETTKIYQSLPYLFRKFIPERAEDIKRYGIAPNDSDWVKLVKSAIQGNPKSDNIYITVIPISD